MIIFSKLRYKNFLSTGNTWIEIDFCANSKTLIVGKNGAGKSQMIDALTFALYGKAFRKINLSQLVNSINQKRTLVELEFKIGSTKYKIVRGILPAKFEIYVNGKLKPQDAGIKDYQRFLENNILKMNEKTFRQIVVLGSTSYVPFMRLTAADRRMVVENLLDIQIFSVMNFLIRTKINTLTDEFKDVTSELKLLDNTLELKKQHIEEQKANVVEKIEANIAEIKLLKDKIAGYEQEKKTLDSEVLGLSRILAEQKTVKEKRSKIREFRSLIQRNRDKFVKEVEFFETATECPKCLQQIDVDFKHDHICKTKEKMSKAEEGLNKAEEEIEKLDEQINNIEQIIKDIQNKEKRIVYLLSEIVSIEAYIKKLVSENEQIVALRQTKLDDSELFKIQEQIDDQVEKKNGLNQKGYYYSIIIDMLKDGGIKTKIIRTYLPIINKLIRKYLDIMEFNIDFTFDESFNETISDRKRELHTYFSLSEGEKMRVDLCLLFTWRELTRLKNSAATNLLIFDEIGDSSLDSEGFDAFMKIIGETSKNQNVFIISHKGDIMSDKFTNIISFEKKGEFTEMVV